jgi:S-DNA-T family DNA segregation ATPase FtsK/SpoIIIE
MQKSLKTKEKIRSLRGEITGIVFAALALLSGLSLVFYHMEASSWVGLLGNNIAWILFASIGYSAYIFPLLFAMLAYEFIFREGLKARISIPISLILFIISSSGLLVLALGEALTGKASYGGIVGDFVTNRLDLYLGPVGTFVVLLMIFLISLRIGTGISLIQLFEKAVGFVIYSLRGSAKAGVSFSVWLRERKAASAEAKTKKATIKAEVKEAKEKDKRLKKRGSPNIITTVAPKKEAEAKGKEQVQEQFRFAQPEGSFQLPATSLLDKAQKKEASIDEETLITNSKILEKKLKDFDVDGSVVEVRPGPVVTMYEYEPAPGVKVNKIINLADDLALAMRAMSLRILAPIPGKAVVGIEVPNQKKEGILFREMVESEAFTESKAAIPLAFGKDISGMPFVADLAKMPHLLIAGATGSGKSVFVNAIILSILYKLSPAEVRFLMIDPKMLELSAYEGIPHLLTPVVTESKRGAGMLRGIVTEMEKRYKLMAEVGAKNISHYNELVVENPGHNDTEHKKLPYIVVVIDELADLMMTAGKDVEDALVRLSQMARASGIHLLVATQRPSADVITGLIKTNFPARISFQVPSRTDSRIILDSMGAEALLGEGDMLFMPPGSTKLKRVHGAYVTDKEIKATTEFWKKQGAPSYDKAIAEAKLASKSGAGLDGEEEYNEEFMERFEAAVKLASGLEMISTSYIQRRFRIGYNTAARIIEKMEADGIVGPAQGSKPREVIKGGLEEL